MISWNRACLPGLSVADMFFEAIERRRAMTQRVTTNDWGVPYCVCPGGSGPEAYAIVCTLNVNGTTSAKALCTKCRGLHLS